MYARITTTQIKLDKLGEAQKMIDDYLEPLLKGVKVPFTITSCLLGTATTHSRGI